MANLNLQCEYPFWLPGNFLFHTQLSDHRLEIFEAWIEIIKSNKISGKTIHNKLNKNQKGNKHAPNPIWDQVLSVLKYTKWTTPGFHHVKSDIPSSQNHRFLPVNLSNSKGGALIGYLSYSEIAKKLNIDLNRENRECPGIENAFYFLDTLKEFYKTRFRDEIRSKFPLNDIVLEIVIYDWSLGIFSFNYEFDINQISNSSLGQLDNLAENLQNIFVKSYLQEEKFNNYLTEFPKLFQVLEDFKTLRKEAKHLSPFICRGGLKNPFYVYLDYVIKSLVHTMPPAPPVEERIVDGKIRTNGIVEGFFEVKLELNRFGKLTPFKEEARFPFILKNFIFIATTQGEFDDIVGLDFTKLIETQTNQKLHATSPNSDEWINKCRSGFRGNVIIEHIPPSSLEKTLSEELPSIKSLYRTLWLCRLGMLHFGALHRMHAHLVSRKGLHIEALALANTKNYSFKGNSIEEEIQRMESLRIAIETLIQESSLTFLGDNHYYRLVFKRIQEGYHFEELIDNIRKQTPLLIDDLDSDNQKRQTDKLSALRYFIFISLTISFVMAYLKIIEIPKIKNILLNGLWEVNWFPHCVLQFFNYAGLFLLMFMICILIYRQARIRYGKN